MALNLLSLHAYVSPDVLRVGVRERDNGRFRFRHCGSLNEHQKAWEAENTLNSSDRLFSQGNVGQKQMANRGLHEFNVCFPSL